MNIIFFSRLFYPHIGGVEKHVLEVSRRLVKKGLKVVVVSEQYKADLRLNEKIGGIEIYRIPKSKDDWFKKFKIWWWLVRHLDLIGRADIIHTHDVFFWYLPFRFLYPTKPVFVTFHGYETKFPPSKKAIFIRKLSEKLSFGNICVGDYIKKWYGTNPTYVTYGGVNIDKTQNSPASDGAKLKILFIGRLEEDTGIPIYLKTLEILKKKKISFDFEACGEGSQEGKVEKWGKVQGFVKDPTLFITRSNLVFTSSYLSILEAMVNKRLVLAVFDNPLKKDYLKMTPFAKWIIIVGNPENLAKRLVYYLNNPAEKEKIVNTGYNWVKEKTWESMVDLYLNLWSVKVDYNN